MTIVQIRTLVSATLLETVLDEPCINLSLPLPTALLESIQGSVYRVDHAVFVGRISVQILKVLLCRDQFVEIRGVYIALVGSSLAATGHTLPQTTGMSSCVRRESTPRSNLGLVPAYPLCLPVSLGTLARCPR